MLNPYIICTWVFLLSLLYPLHGISTFPLNIVCLIGLATPRFTNVSYSSFYHYFSHLGPFLWIPWVFSVKSIILFFLTFVLYILFMILIFKNPLDYYIDLHTKNNELQWLVDLLVKIKDVLGLK
jgi:hypothetical protein